MSEAWGTTGRVTVEELPRTPGAHVVRVDGSEVGHVSDYRGERPLPFFFATSLAPVWRHLGDHRSFDYAVMAVLRRAAPKVWAAERPVVGKVYRNDWTWTWVAHSLDGSKDRVEDAIATATRLTRDQYEEMAR